MARSVLLGTAFKVLLAISCVWIAAPAVRDAMVRLPGDPLRSSVFGFSPLSEAQQDLFADSRQAGAATDQRELGRMLLAVPVDSGKAGLEARLSQAIDLLEDALARSPADSFAWADLALARLRRDGPTQAGLDALALSIATAPGEPSLALWRVAMLLDHEAVFGAETPRLLERQALMAWRYNRGGVVRLLSERGRVHVLRNALADSPFDQEQLENALSQIR